MSQPAETGQEKDPEQSQKCACHGVKQIFQTGPHGFSAPLVENQRQGCKGHQLIKHIQRNQVGREIQSHENSRHDEIITEKPVLFLLVGHIGHRIDPYQQPDRSCQSRKQPTYLIYMKLQCKLVRQSYHGQASP